jgi:hypothetical protein
VMPAACLGGAKGRDDHSGCGDRENGGFDELVHLASILRMDRINPAFMMEEG